MEDHKKRADDRASERLRPSSVTGHSRPPRERPPPELRELLTLRCPRELDARCEEPLEYPEKALELLLLLR